MDVTAKTYIKTLLADPMLYFVDPAEVISDSRFTTHDKRRILTAWERSLYNLKSEQLDDGSSEASRELARVRHALKKLTQLQDAGLG